MTAHSSATLADERKRWLSFLDISLLIVGLVHLLAGIFFFFAYNWSGLAPLVKFGLIQAVLVIGIGITTFLGLRKRVGKIVLTATALVMGALFAVAGQVYQTPADSYTLFLVWSIAIFGWVMVSNFSYLWVIWLGLLNLTAHLYVEQVVQTVDTVSYMALMGMINFAALSLWTIVRNSRDWQNEKWAYYLYTLFPATWATIAGVVVIVDDAPTVQHGWYWLVYPSLCGVSWWYAGIKNRDFYLLTVIATSCNVVLAVAHMKFFLDVGEDSLSLMIVGVLLLAQSLGTLKVLQAMGLNVRNTTQS